MPAEKTTHFTFYKDSNFPVLERDQNIFINVKGIGLRRLGNSDFDFYKFRNLSHTITVDLGIKNGADRKKVALPEDMLRNMATYLRENHARQEPYNCAAFVHQLHGVPFEYPFVDRNRWDIAYVTNPGDFQPGDTIILSSGPSLDQFPMNHFGICLGEDLYLSKCGETGPLIATDLENLKKMYGKHTFRALPKFLI